MTSTQEEIADVFHFYDNKGDKKIAASQIGTCLRSLNLAPTEQMIERMTEKWAKTPDARVSIEEFTPIYHTMKKELGKPIPPEVYINLLGHYDRESNGNINVADLRMVLENSGEKMTAREVDALLFGFDLTEGKVNIAALVKHIMEN